MATGKQATRSQQLLLYRFIESALNIPDEDMIIIHHVTDTNNSLQLEYEIRHYGSNKRRCTFGRIKF